MRIRVLKLQSRVVEMAVRIKRRDTEVMSLISGDEFLST